MLRRTVIFGFILMLCGAAQLAANPPPQAPAPRRTIPAGPFLMGSTPAEREYGYRLDENLHNSTAARRYRWFEAETRRTVELPAYRIDATPVTNAAYFDFTPADSTRTPFVTPDVWRSYGLIHDYDAVQRFLWRGRPPAQRPRPTPGGPGEPGRRCGLLPLARRTRGPTLALADGSGMEKAARGADGRYFPWGNAFLATHLNSYDKGPYDTTPVGQYPQGKSPYGVLDMAGQVFEWTSTPYRGGPKRYTVKGGSWDDYPRRHARGGAPTGVPLISNTF